ncbi:ABC-three component system protein [Haliangium ochraceum]|uniref:ABC-three component systems C-terminal domain-containing protein n=1 Tax=Haliangium ochraceum (strain DSM 14365 / JCM 11303 / SMP-2) TaxID=502025 RepID=D0LQJ7_HALO1|nr:ABC-three component system protein [Haliangium ochraceum]ACY13557.1 conserved hypothetical protein [Haliangium ochraceum DSM 14365]
MRYMLYDLRPGQFENLVVELCHELLGAGVQNFATGPDGGRDAKFCGTAQNYPSQAEPLVGTTIVQAKHTSDVVGRFSDGDFGGASATSTISEEIPRIRALREADQLDHYILFANRRLGGNTDERIKGRLIAETGVSSVYLIGVEQIERYIKRYDYIATTLRGFEHDLPLRASPDDLAEVITAIAAVQSDIDWPATPSASSLQRVAFKKKNEINGLSGEFARYITRNYLKHFDVVEAFLADPINVHAHKAYLDAVDEFAGKLIAYRGNFETYDKLLDYLVNRLIERDGDLRAQKRLTRTVFYFMYWACDIGATEEEIGDAPPE